MMSFNEKMARGFIERATSATNEADAAWFMRQAARYAEKMGTTVEALVAPAAEVKKPCCHVRVIRRFYAICKNAGLDVKEADRMRGAFSLFLGRRVNSRDELNGDEWASLGDAAERGLLLW